MGQKSERKKNTSRIGAVAELSAALDGASKGWSVYQNVSAEGKVDLIFLKDRPAAVLRIQVKKGERVKNGFAALKHNDALALVDSLNRVRYYTINPRVYRLLSPCQMLRRTHRAETKRHKARK